MINLYRRSRGVLLKVYVASALVIATVLSPLALSIIPIVLLVWYLVLWRWPVTAAANLLTDYFMFFAIALLLASTVSSPFSLLIALPVLLLIHHDLEETAESLTYKDTRHVRRPTSICLALISIALAVLCMSLLFGSLPLLLASAAVTSYLGILSAVALRWLPLKPVEETQVEQRIVARTEEHLYIKLTTKTKIGGLLFVESPYEWLQVNPEILSFKQNKPIVKVSLSPALSGPSIVKLKGHATDRWGLIQVKFELEPIRLYVIPRARYAAWLAKKYLTETTAGILPMMSNLGALKSIAGLKRGVEYYGNQLYQPGDSLKSIDWKHSLKYSELVTKEFMVSHGQSAVVLINLAAGNADEADELAYKIITTAISLAQENIPAALATYDHENVKLTTGTLQPQQLLISSLQVAQEMVTFINPVKYLHPPDVTRLRANISRIRFAESKASEVLLQLLQLEYKNISNNARLNPATKALSEVLAKVDKRSNIVIISHRNHDAEALSFNTFNFAKTGNAVITV